MGCSFKIRFSSLFLLTHICLFWLKHHSQILTLNGLPSADHSFLVCAPVKSNIQVLKSCQCGIIWNLSNKDRGVLFLIIHNVLQCSWTRKTNKQTKKKQAVSCGCVEYHPQRCECRCLTTTACMQQTVYVVKHKIQMKQRRGSSGQFVIGLL